MELEDYLLIYINSEGNDFTAQYSIVHTCKKKHLLTEVIDQHPLKKKK